MNLFSFEGRFRSRRQPPYVVNSVGLIQQKQEERRQRARLNKEENAATCIQSFIRGALSRKYTQEYLHQTYRQLAEKLSSVTSNRADDALYAQSLCTCLRAFKLIGDKSRTEDDVILFSKVLLTPSCQALYFQWLNADERPILSTLTRGIAHILAHLRTLLPGAPSKLYVLPVRVLEVYLQGNNSEQAATSLQRLSLALCQRGRYYFSLAIFIDQQSLGADGEDDVNEDAMEDFFKQPKNRALLELLQLPFKHCLPKNSTEKRLEPVTQEFLTSALTDVSSAANCSIGGQRLAQSKIPRLVFPVLLKAIPSEMLIGQLYASAISEGSGEPTVSAKSLQPSLTLLHHFLCEIIPDLVRLVPPVQQNNRDNRNGVTYAEGEEEEEQTELILQQQLWTTTQVAATATDDSSLVLAVLRILGWMFSALLTARCPGTLGETHFAPPFPPAPLKHAMDDGDAYGDMDTDEDEDAGVESHDSLHNNAASDAFLRFVNVWPSQTAEVFASLQKCLPTVAGIALQELYSPQKSSSSTGHSQRRELILSLATLHSMLSFVKSSSANTLIPLNSVLSQCPEFLRDLWDLTLNYLSVGERAVESTGMMWRPTVRFFDLLASGEMKSLPLKIDQYTAIVVTLSDCLRHRLLCLTDVEINGPSADPLQAPSTAIPSCGFTPAELLQMGARLRDLMLGLISLAYPAQRPDTRALPSKATAMREVLERVQQRAAAAAEGSRRDVSSLSATENDPTRLRWILHRWATLFGRVQALVTLIYDWDHRRQGRETVYLTRRRRMLSSDEGDASTIWLKPGALPAFRPDKLPKWLLRSGGAVALAGAPFGYYSQLNADLDEDLFSWMSYMDWRLMTTLMEMPFVITFWMRVQIFQSLVYSSRRYVQNTVTHSLDFVPEAQPDRITPIRIRARRGYVYEDAFESLSKENAPSLLARLNVTFYNKADVIEMGVDGGGLSREFLAQVLTEGFNPTRGFFLYTDDNTLYPNPNAEAVTPDYLKHFYFLGRILAKAIYEGMLVELRFAHFFLAKLVSRTGGFGVGFDYLRSLDQELYRQLCMLKTYQGNVRDLELDFTTVQASFGESKVVELKPNGASIPVTNATRVEYVNLVANYKLNRQIYRQSKAFIAGMTDVIYLEWLRLFDAEELQVLISGADAAIDVDDLRTYTQYVGDMTIPENKRTIEYFWQIFASFTQEQKRGLLRFATACSRPPMFGFQDLEPPFTIQMVSDTDRLPTASTCMNLLKLPAYQDPEALSSKLLYALNSNAGFEYS